MFSDWDDTVDKITEYYGSLHEKLVIIIPKSGRTVEPIPGCEKVSSNSAQDYDENSESHVKQPIVCALKDAVGVKQYSTTHVYQIEDDNMVRRKSMKLHL